MRHVKRGLNASAKRKEKKKLSSGHPALSALAEHDFFSISYFHFYRLKLI